MPRSIYTKDIKTGRSITMVMPRRMRRMAPIAYPVKTKNQISLKESSIAGTKHRFDLVTSLAPGEQRTLSGQVQAGDHVYRINLSVNATIASSAGNTDFDFYVACIRSGQTLGTLPSADWSDIGLSNLRNQIIYSEQNQIGSEDAGPLKRKISIKIPKIYQRIRQGDFIMFVYDNPGDDVQVNLGARYSSFS